MADGHRKKAAKKRASGKRKAPARPAAAPPRPVLGNDPFTRGAAPRVPAMAAPAPVGARSTHPTSTPTAAPTDAAGLPPPPFDRLGGSGDPGGTPTPSPSPTPSPAPSRLPTRRTPPAAAAAARLSDLEAKLDSALDGLESRLADAATRAGLGHARAELGETLRRLLPAVRARLGTIGELARLLEPPDRLDRFGMDPRLSERAEPLVELLYASWWRVAVRGAEQVPAAGPAIVVANHAGLVPWDALVLRHALRRDHPARRDLRPLLDDREVDMPFLGGLAVRLGAIRAEPDAASRILAGGGLLGVFPEGSAGARKPWRDRYRIQRFGRGGFAKIALRARAPIVPCAIVGSEEASPGISRTGWLAERLGIPLLSASPVLTLGPAALVPLPSKWSLRFGAPIDPTGFAAEAADDPAVVAELAERTRSALQAMLDEDVAARSSVFL